jgi:hypothetical protein
MRLAVFAYGSLVSAASAGRTLGRAVEPGPRARLAGWERGWTLTRDNVASEKTFAVPGGALPAHCLGLNVLERPGDGPNGALIEVSRGELERLALREVRYDTVEVSDAIRTEKPHGFERVLTFTAKAANLAPAPPPESVILASYVRAVEEAFDSLGTGELELFRETTGPHPVDVVEAVLVRDRIPPGNPREW